MKTSNPITRKEILWYIIKNKKEKLLELIIVLCVLWCLLPSCKKEPAKEQPKNYTITFKVTGTGNYHYQKGGITAQGHVIGSQSFVVGAITGDGIELDAVNDTITKPISIEVIGSQSNFTKSGPGQQQINFTLN